MDEKAAWKTEFLSLVAHELLTPLTPVIGYAATLLRHGDRMTEADRRRALHTILRRSQQLARLVEYAVTLEGLDAGSMVIAPAEVMLEPALSLALTGRAPAGFDVSCPPGLEVRADPRMLHVMLGALIDNALEYGQAPREIVVAAVGAAIEIRVYDAGSGVPREFVPQAADRFRQASTGLARAHGGLGFGLAVAQELARRHGGAVWYEPGARRVAFGLRLPRAGPDPALPDVLITRASALATEIDLTEEAAVIDLVALAAGDASAVEAARRGCLRLGISIPACRRAAHLLALAMAEEDG